MAKRRKKQKKLAKSDSLRYNVGVSSSLEITVYKTPTGRSPFHEFLDTLDKPVRARVISRIDRLRDTGAFGNAKALKDGIAELKMPSPAIRIYYALIGKKVVLLISGSDKKTQNTAIKKAKEYFEEYRSRHESENKKS